MECLTLLRCLGITSRSNTTFLNSKTGDLCYAAGGVIVFYSPRRNRQTKFCFADAPVSALALSRDEKFLCAGVKGVPASLIIFDASTCVVAEWFHDVHPTCVDAVAFNTEGDKIASAGSNSNKCSLTVNSRDSPTFVRVYILLVSPDFVCL